MVLLINVRLVVPPPKPPLQIPTSAGPSKLPLSVVLIRRYGRAASKPRRIEDAAAANVEPAASAEFPVSVLLPDQGRTALVTIILDCSAIACSRVANESAVVMKYHGMPRRTTIVFDALHRCCQPSCQEGTPTTISVALPGSPSL